jgi:glycosyltransferase involved in cell wall biosynthesis
MAHCLEKEGYEVDVFLYRSDNELADDLLKGSSRIRIHRFGEGASASIVQRGEHRSRNKIVLMGLARLFLPAKLRHSVREARERALLHICPGFGLIPKFLVRVVIERSESNPYIALIGVEKGGLAWAGAVAEQTQNRVGYYSLELYTRDHPWIISSHRMKRLKVVEERYHRKCAFTLVQDEYRGRVLLSDNGVKSKMQVVYLPISLSGPQYDAPSNWLSNELGLKQDKILILSYGEISERRFSIDLARLAQEFPEEWKLVLHGYGSSEVIETIRSIDTQNRVGLSLRLVHAGQQQEVVRSAKIGLALYGKKPLNDQLTGRSSEKIALYFQCGIPLIAFKHQSYEHIEAEKSGILIDHLEDIPQAIAEILKNYDTYAQNAFRCFKKYYSFEENFPALLACLRQTGDS